MGMLYGEGDFTKTLDVATRLGGFGLYRIAAGIWGSDVRVEAIPECIRIP
jgi:hypothetical protein